MMVIKQLRIVHQSTTLVDISFAFERSLALVGQSGSGKSLTLKALLGMLPSSMQMKLELEAPFALKRGETVALVPQNPFTALSPLSRIRDQFFVSQQQRKALMAKVELDDQLLDRFPTELSGGQLQRVVLAIALGSNPKLLLLDEPTTALDPETRTRMIVLLKALQESLGFLMLFVTHDMTSAEALCDEICVIRDGARVEYGPMASVLHAPKTAYTRMLIDANFAHREFRV
jgi:ABC-type glutathione transport system ATPase component